MSYENEGTIIFEARRNSRNLEKFVEGFRKVNIIINVNEYRCNSNDENQMVSREF